MKATGIVRPVDALGRVVIPVELRRNLGIKTEDSLEVFVDGEYIMLKKELDIIGGKTERGRKRMECMELHRTREEMDELREIIKEAEKQLLLAYQTK